MILQSRNIIQNTTFQVKTTELVVIVEAVGYPFIIYLSRNQNWN